MYLFVLLDKLAIMYRTSAAYAFWGGEENFIDYVQPLLKINE